ncbi:MAG: hypothetical protein Q7U47_16095 [Paludibacter sp.]|nr:hypothetical protein [Paludibacter sp.]
MYTLRKNLSNIPGWRTNRKIVVIESDDWGSVRTRSKKDYDEMLAKGLEVNRSNFTKYDALESNDDLEQLFDVLSKHKDSTGRHPVLTPMCVVANPDFEKIKASGFQVYHYENFVDTCNCYPNHNRVLDLWRKGIKDRLFVPALHGREHLSVSRWMKLLQENNEGLRIAFDHESWGVSRYKGKEISEYLGAFHPDHASDIPDLVKIIESAGELFKENCGYAPTHFIAPNRESAKALDETFGKIGVKYLTMAKLRHYPLGDDKYKSEFLWLGKQNKELNQLYITRNCGFEPSSSTIDWVNSCINEIVIAFKWRKPAVISSHRVNYIGSINPNNAKQGLNELNRLLSEIIKNWPEVEFMTSTELGEIIALTKK